jgi:hypothetical protein
MVAKKKSPGGSKVKVNKLKVNKETIKDLGSKESKTIKGGQRGTVLHTRENGGAC